MISIIKMTKVLFVFQIIVKVFCVGTALLKHKLEVGLLTCIHTFHINVLIIVIALQFNICLSFFLSFFLLTILKESATM